MSSLSNIKLKGIPRDIFLEYIKLYKRIGESEKIIEFLDESHPVYMDNVVKDDIFYLFDIYFKDAKISDARKKTIISSKISDFRNVEENILFQLVRAFEYIRKYDSFDPLSREYQELSLLIGRKELKGGYKKNEKDKDPYSVRLDKIIDEYHHALKNNPLDDIYMATALFIDYLKLSPMKEYNELIGLIILYVQLQKSDCKSFKYFSFFKELHSRYDEFKMAINKSFHLYDEGMNDIYPVLRIILDIAWKSYDDLELTRRNVSFDKQLKKAETIEAIIYKLPESFSKNDIRAKIPDVSESTIDRCLKKMQEEGKIASFGRGRGAEWLRLDHSHDENQNFD